MRAAPPPSCRYAPWFAPLPEFMRPRLFCMVYISFVWAFVASFLFLCERVFLSRNFQFSKHIRVSIPSYCWRCGSSSPLTPLLFSTEHEKPCVSGEGCYSEQDFQGGRKKLSCAASPVVAPNGDKALLYHCIMHLFIYLHDGRASTQAQHVRTLATPTPAVADSDRESAL